MSLCHFVTVSVNQPASGTILGCGTMPPLPHQPLPPEPDNNGCRRFRLVIVTSFGDVRLAPSMGWSWSSYRWPISPCLQLNPRVSSFASQPLKKHAVSGWSKTVFMITTTCLMIEKKQNHTKPMFDYWNHKMFIVQRCVIMFLSSFEWRYIAVSLLSLLVRFLADSSCPRSVATPTFGVKWKKCGVAMRKKQFPGWKHLLIISCSWLKHIKTY